MLTSPPPPEDTSVALNDVLNTVGAFVPSATINLSLPSKLNLSKLYLPALVLPLSTVVHEEPPANVVAVNISDFCNVPLELNPVVLLLVQPFICKG